MQKKNSYSFALSELGKEIAGKEISVSLAEEVTPELIKNWSKNIKFRSYDIHSPAPKISGGKRHFVNQIVSHARKIWLELGFKEMSGQLTETSFWNFDVLFTPQDHPARDLQDTFFIRNIRGKLPDMQIVEAVKKAHESGIAKSKGWGYSWSNEEAKKVVLRTHTTSLSARTLAQMKESDFPAKYFAIGKVFRNETLDASHLFEFYQTEGIVLDKEANFKHLLSYLKTFLNKMGFSKIRFRPHFFPYTEPSVEADIYNENTGKWIEVLGAGIFRPEVVVPLIGKYVPVLAWGMGLDRMVKESYGIKDLRDEYSNDIQDLRDKNIFIKK